MRFTKVRYYITGRFPAGNEYGIITRLKVVAWKPTDRDDIGIRKNGKLWYVDHIPSGYSVTPFGEATREKALKSFHDHYEKALNKKISELPENFYRNIANIPTEEEVKTWEKVK